MSRRVSLRRPAHATAARAAIALLCLTLALGPGCLPPITDGGPASPTAPARRATPLPTPTAPSTATPTPPGVVGVRAEVLDVIDGDTIRVSIDGETHTVRYIGIDAPELAQADRPADWLGPEATAKNAELVADKVVTLEKDVSETDRFGRLLRYVYVGDLLVNGELVRLGYARAPSYPPDVGRQDLLRQMEAEARAAGRGIWGPTPTPAAPVDETPTPVSREGCDAAYPDVCIPPPPPDLDCADIPHRNFRVLPPDPHRFDGGNDGIGCEGVGAE